MKTAAAALAMLSSITTLAGCAQIAPLSPKAAQVSRQRGTVIKIESLGRIHQAQLQSIAADFPGNISVRYSAELFRVTYWTALKGKPTEASGLFAVPLDTSSAKGVVMYLHGTNSTRAFAPSQPDRVDGNEESAIFAGNGYYVVLPDYIGLGISQIPHPYLVTAPQVDASIDMLRAVRKIATTRRLVWSPNLFMMGFSQGGQVVAGVQRALERRGLPDYRLRGSVGIAGPYDLRKTALPKALENECRQCVGYLAWGAYAYATYYNARLGGALKAEYVNVVPRLFNGSKTATEIGAALPEDPKDIFQPEFLKAMQANTDNWFTRALDKNETYRWSPVAPLRLYFGDVDKDVPPSASKAFFEYANARGGNISKHALGPVDHQTSASMAYAPALKWFDEMALRAPGATGTIGAAEELRAHDTNLGLPD